METLLLLAKDKRTEKKGGKHVRRQQEREKKLSCQAEGIKLDHR